MDPIILAAGRYSKPRGRGPKSVAANGRYTPPHERPVALYARLSRNPDGKKESVPVQLKRGHVYGGERWPGREIRVFSDDGISAADSEAYRPGYQAMLEAIRNGEIGDIMAAEQDRITRQPTEWFQIAAICEAAGFTVGHFWLTGVEELDSLAGNVKALVDAEYVKSVKRKVNQANESRAEEGRPGGGTSFGYIRSVDERGRKIMLPDPALNTIDENGRVVGGVAMWMAERILAGDSYATIIRGLNEQNVPSARGGVWASPNIRAILTAPTITGLRVFRGEVIGEGTWVPLIDRETFVRVQAAIARRTKSPTRPARRFTCTAGLAVCGNCGASLKAQQCSDRVEPRYQCYPMGGSCGGVAITARLLESQVEKEALTWLRDGGYHVDPEGDEFAEERGRLLHELDLIEGRRQESALAFATGQIDRAGRNAEDQELDQHKGEVESRLVEVAVPLPEIDFAALLQSWERLSAPERRQAYGGFINVVLVDRIGRGQRSTPDRIHVKFKKPVVVLQPALA